MSAPSEPHRVNTNRTITTPYSAEAHAIEGEPIRIPSNPSRAATTRMDSMLDAPRMGYANSPSTTYPTQRVPIGPTGPVVTFRRIGIFAPCVVLFPEQTKHTTKKS